MIQRTITPNYETLKSAFVNGMEFKRMPLETYLAKHPVEKKIDNEALAEVFKGIYVNRNSSQMLKTKATMLGTDWAAVTEKVATTGQIYATFDKGKHLLEDTFNRGRKNPAICFMAWYDALAEYVISVANSQIGQKAPIPVINEELSALAKNLSKNLGFNDAKRNVYNELKRIYPKTYKKRLKLMEQSYNKKVQNGITEIVRMLVK